MMDADRERMPPDVDRLIDVITCLPIMDEEGRMARQEALINLLIIKVFSQDNYKAYAIIPACFKCKQSAFSN